jgi:hypothetical protein
MACIYLLIGAAIMGFVMLDPDVREDSADWEPFDLLGFIVYMIFTWPSIFWMPGSGSVWFSRGLISAPDLPY